MAGSRQCAKAYVAPCRLQTHVKIRKLVKLLEARGLEAENPQKTKDLWKKAGCRKNPWENLLSDVLGCVGNLRFVFWKVSGKKLSSLAFTSVKPQYCGSCPHGSLELIWLWLIFSYFGPYLRAFWGICCVCFPKLLKQIQVGWVGSNPRSNHFLVVGFLPTCFFWGGETGYEPPGVTHWPVGSFFVCFFMFFRDVSLRLGSVDPRACFWTIVLLLKGTLAQLGQNKCLWSLAVAQIMTRWS